jgi:hypothetical protein
MGISVLLWSPVHPWSLQADSRAFLHFRGNQLNSKIPCGQEPCHSNRSGRGNEFRKDKAPAEMLGLLVSVTRSDILAPFPVCEWGMKPTVCRGANPWPRIRYNVLSSWIVERW